MTAHAKAGVDKGMASVNRMPIEVMGYVQAYVDPTDERCIMCAASPSPFPSLPALRSRASSLTAPRPAACRTPLK